MSHAALAAEDRNVADRGFSGRRWRVRTLLLVLVLVPSIGMAALASFGAVAARSEQRASQRVRDSADDLGPTIDALSAVANEEISSTVVTIAAELGLDLPGVSEVLGLDYADVVAANRAATDANPLIHAGASVGLAELRRAIDAGTASFTDVTPVFRMLADEIGDGWQGHLDDIASTLASEALPGELHTLVQATEGTFDALTTGNVRATIVSRLALAKRTPSDLGALIAATALYDAALTEFPPHLGRLGAAAWNEHTSDEGAQRFEATLDASEEQLLLGTAVPAPSEPVDVASRIRDADRWATTLTATVTASAHDLRVEAAEHADAAATRLQTQVGLAGLLTLLSVGGAAFLARSVARPIRRLEAAAHALHEGRFDLPPLDTDGPKELAQTAVAFKRDDRHPGHRGGPRRGPGRRPPMRRCSARSSPAARAAPCRWPSTGSAPRSGWPTSSGASSSSWPPTTA